MPALDRLQSNGHQSEPMNRSSNPGRADRFETLQFAFAPLGRFGGEPSTRRCGEPVPSAVRERRSAKQPRRRIFQESPAASYPPLGSGGTIITAQTSALGSNF